MHIGKISSEKKFEETNKRPLMYPFRFGSLIELCCCFKFDSLLTDSINYYTQNENEIQTQISDIKTTIMNKPRGILFITFQNKNMAAYFLKHYRLGLMGNFLQSTCLSTNQVASRSCYMCQDLPKASSLSRELRSNSWSAKFAPLPNNIKWENVAKIGASWWLRCIFINLILVILMVFFTTPSILIEKLSQLGEVLKMKTVEVLRF